MDRGPAWEFAERVQIKVAYSRYGVAHWLSRSRLADCCAMLSFRSPYTSVAAADLRRHGRSLVRAALDQQGPDNAGHLVGQGDGDQHPRPTAATPGLKASDTCRRSTQRRCSSVSSTRPFDARITAAAWAGSVTAYEPVSASTRRSW